MMPASNPPKFLRWLSRWFPGNQSFRVPEEGWLQSWNLKELMEGHHQEWSLLWLNLIQHGKPHQSQTSGGLTDWELVVDSVGGGARPFLVGGAIFLVNSDNEQESRPLNSHIRNPLCYQWHLIFLEGQASSSCTRLSSNRSVISFDVLRRTHATLKESACPPWPQGSGNPLNLLRARECPKFSASSIEVTQLLNLENQSETWVLSSVCSQKTLQTFQNFHNIFTKFKEKFDANPLFFQVCHSQGTPELQMQQHTLVLHKTLLHKSRVSFQAGKDASDSTITTLRNRSSC